MTDSRPASAASEAPAQAPEPVWIVAGPPGSGKSTVADLLVPLLRPAPALLDKDTLFSGFVAEVLAAHDRPFGEREGAWYDEHVKLHEYGGLTAAARQIRALGTPVLLVAPFTTQIRDPARWRAWVKDLGGAPVRLLWVRSDPDRLHHHLLARGRGRDAAKLGDFAAFVTRMAPGTPPPVDHREIDNTGDLTHLREQVRAVASAMS